MHISSAHEVGLSIRNSEIL